VDAAARRRSAADPAFVIRELEAKVLVDARARARRAVAGYPFNGVVDFRDGALVWCRVNPPPGELVATDPSRIPSIPLECHDPG
jgi:hypothetical protein